MINTYIQKLLQSRQQAHIFHLSTTSYSTHIALQTYYESIVEMVDGLVESYQGKYGILTLDLTVEETTYLDVVSYFIILIHELEVMRSELPNDNFLQHQYDDIETLIYTTLYKLRYLK